MSFCAFWKPLDFYLCHWSERLGVSGRLWRVARVWWCSGAWNTIFAPPLPLLFVQQLWDAVGTSVASRWLSHNPVNPLICNFAMPKLLGFLWTLYASVCFNYKNWLSRFSPLSLYIPHIFSIFPGSYSNASHFSVTDNISLATRWCMQRTARSRVGKFALQPGSQDTSRIPRVLGRHWWMKQMLTICKRSFCDWNRSGAVSLRSFRYI